MLNETDIQTFLDKKDYDIRKSGTKNGSRWIDQKCKPDLLWSIADIICNYIEKEDIDKDIHKEDINKKNDTFTAKDLWTSKYAKIIAETFSKPDLDDKKASKEYDKVFGQPLRLFCYAGVLIDIANGRNHVYKVADRKILDYIATSDNYTYRFLLLYIKKVLKDSGLYADFEEFFNKQTSESFNKLKSIFCDFYHKYTYIKKDLELGRIFPKVLNPLAYSMRKRGAEKGRLSSDVIKKHNIMYNGDNFRDIYAKKPKGKTRQEWLKENPAILRKESYFKQQLSRSVKNLKTFIKEYRNNQSELTMFINGYDDTADATQIHHIFPKSEFPDIMHYIENLIALTPNQHYGFAHPKNNTNLIDFAAQKILLIAKTCSIKQNLESFNEEHIYDFNNLLTVLSVGWTDDEITDIAENDYDDVLHAINYHYQIF